MLLPEDQLSAGFLRTRHGHQVLPFFFFMKLSGLLISLNWRSLKWMTLRFKKSIEVNSVQLKEEDDLLSRLIHHFSSWFRLKKAFAWILRFKNLLSSFSQKRKQLILSFAHSDLNEQQKISVEREMRNYYFQRSN